MDELANHVPQTRHGPLSRLPQMSMVFLPPYSPDFNPIEKVFSKLKADERLRMGFPHGHRKTTTLVAGLRNTGMAAPLVIDGPNNGEWFEAYVAQVLVPTLKPGNVV